MKCIIAMSGGVDSSVAALLMKAQGHDCIGATMKLFKNEDIGLTREHTCCSLEDVEHARQVARSLDIPHYVFNFSDRFRECVINRFVQSYENGMTPNPCIDCNRHLKFDKLMQRMRELSYDYVVTGHYARIEYDDASGRYLLKRAVDAVKDQTYFLYSMTQQQLAHTCFPLGSLTKPEVRRIAEEHGFINARKHDSQDICFVQRGNYAFFIEGYAGKTYPPGDFIGPDGSVIGRHRGIIRYTIGQRKGLNIAYGEPLYVRAIDPAGNRIFLGRDKDMLTHIVIARNINLISAPHLEKPVRVQAKLRSCQNAQWATAVQSDQDALEIRFDTPQRIPAKGQAAVLYDGDTVVGGGTIQ